MFSFSQLSDDVNCIIIVLEAKRKASLGQLETRLRIVMFLRLKLPWLSVPLNVLLDMRKYQDSRDFVHATIHIIFGM
jgi:hypothetical protein